MEENTLTTQERRAKQKAQLKARLAKLEALDSREKRKERDGQLIAWGVLVEEMFKSGESESRQKWIDSANKHLKDRNLARALAGFQRIAGEGKSREPSQRGA